MTDEFKPSSRQDGSPTSGRSAKRSPSRYSAGTRRNVPASTDPMKPIPPSEIPMMARRLMPRRAGASN